MKHALYFAALLISCVIFAGTAFSQNFENTSACVSLQSSIQEANTSAERLVPLLSAPQLDAKAYLEQLYEGSKILSEAGGVFFNAGQEHESACRNALLEAKSAAELAKIYTLYSQALERSYAFFARAKSVAQTLERPGDVEALTQIATEYQSAALKLVSKCKADLQGTDSSACAALETRLMQIMH